MKVAVTGSSGQLGTQVLRRLIAERAVSEIVALDVRPPRLSSRKLRAVQADVRDEGLGEHFQGCDALVHLAFLITRQRPHALVDSVNVGGSKNVFRAAAAAGVKTVVYSSSVAAYGVVPGHPSPIVEETPRILQEAFPYAAAKYRVEEFLDGYEKEHPDIAVARLRPSILIGPGMEHPLGAWLKRRVLLDFGASALPLVWNEDVADAVVLALKKRARGAYLLSADEQLSARALAEAVGYRYLRVSRPAALALARASRFLAPFRLMEEVDRAWIEANDVEQIFSSKKAREVLGWKPRCNTSIEVMRRYDEVVPEKLSFKLRAFMGAVGLAGRARAAQVELSGFSSRIHLALTGKGGGDVGIVVEQGRMGTTRAAPVPPTAVVTLKASLFADLLAGRADIGTAQLTGRIRVEGEGHALLIVAGLISQFRSAAEARGLRGRAAKIFQRWVAGELRPPEVPATSPEVRADAASLDPVQAGRSESAANKPA